MAWSLLSGLERGQVDMKLSIHEIDQIKDNVRTLLDQIGLDAYLFEVEPSSEEEWAVKIECAMESGWERQILSASKAALATCHEDPSVRQDLLDHWKDQLSSCKRV